MTEQHSPPKGNAGEGPGRRRIEAATAAACLLLALAACRGGPRPGASDAAGSGQADGQPSTAAAGASPAINARLLVSPAWLAAHLDRPDLVILDVEPDSAAYARGHVPGSRLLPLTAVARTRHDLPNQVPPDSSLAASFQGVGVGDRSRIVLYGPPLAAARAFVALDALGLGDSAALLDGGLAAWRARGGPVTTTPSPTSRGRITPRAVADPIVAAAWVERHLHDPRIALLDARPPDQFSGALPGKGIPRPGHIPGASNLFWQTTIVSPARPTLLPADSLRALFRRAGVAPGDTVVTYCQTGMESSFLYFVSRYLGYPTRLYDGSFYDWSRRLSLPVARGE